jgi:hypothetical protein
MLAKCKGQRWDEYRIPHDRLGVGRLLPNDLIQGLVASFLLWTEHILEAVCVLMLFEVFLGCVDACERMRDTKRLTMAA